MSEEQENEVLGRTLKEYQSARRRLSALHAEAGRLGEYLITAGDALKTNHSLWPGDHYDLGSAESVDFKKWPTAEQISHLIEDINAAQGGKDRLAGILEGAGFKQPD